MNLQVVPAGVVGPVNLRNRRVQAGLAAAGGFLVNRFSQGVVSGAERIVTETGNRAYNFGKDFVSTMGRKRRRTSSKRPVKASMRQLAVSAGSGGGGYGYTRKFKRRRRRRYGGKKSLKNFIKRQIKYANCTQGQKYVTRSHGAVATFGENGPGSPWGTNALINGVCQYQAFSTGTRAILSTIHARGKSAATTGAVNDVDYGPLENKKLYYKCTLKVVLRNNNLIPIDFISYKYIYKDDSDQSQTDLIKEGINAKLGSAYGISTSPTFSDWTGWRAPQYYPSYSEVWKHVVKIVGKQKFRLMPGEEKTLIWKMGWNKYDDDIEDAINNDANLRGKTKGFLLRSLGVIGHDATANQRDDVDYSQHAYDYVVTRDYWYKHEGGTSARVDEEYTNVDTVDDMEVGMGQDAVQENVNPATQFIVGQ